MYPELIKLCTVVAGEEDPALEQSMLSAHHNITEVNDALMRRSIYVLGSFAKIISVSGRVTLWASMEKEWNSGGPSLYYHNITLSYQL